MSVKYAVFVALFGLTSVSVAIQADPIVFESFTGYPNDALISDSPAGPAIGLTGDWQLDPENFFYVNMTEADPEAGSDQAVYDMPWDDNGARTAQRVASPEHALFEQDGDVFYASMRIVPPVAEGVMTIGLDLKRLDGGGQPNLTFGINEGAFIVGNGGVNVDVLGGISAATEMQIVLRVEYGDGGLGPDDLEIITVWVDPAEETSVPVIEAVPVDFLNRGGGRLAGVFIRGDHMAGQPAFFDDLMVGYTFEDVVQSPSGNALTNHAGLNGLFYDPANPGHGFNFAVHNLGLTVYYFGHTVAGERLWLVSRNHTGDVEFGRPIELQMYEVITGTYGHPQLPVTSWGYMTIEMADCDTGHASLDGNDGVLEVDFVRLSAMPGIDCQ